MFQQFPWNTITRHDYLCQLLLAVDVEVGGAETEKYLYNDQFIRNTGLLAL